MKNTTQRRPGGFTLIEAMIAMVVLLVALVGALAGLISASQEFRAGQIRQAEMVLVEAKSQRMMLMDHTTGPVSWPSALQWNSAPLTSSWPYQLGPEFVAPGTNMWVVDPDPPQCPPYTDPGPPVVAMPGCSAVAGGVDGPLDLSVGAYFIISPDGTIRPDLTVAPGTPCNSSAIPKTTFCRELVIGQGIEASAGNLSTQVLPLNHTGYTIWIRIVRNGQMAAGGDQFYSDPSNGYFTSVGTVYHHDVWVN